MLSKAFSLLPTVALLFAMGFFMFASPPLLILKHDTPTDARFIRGLFNLYYLALMTIATLGAAGCAATGQFAVASAMGGLAFFVFALRRWLIARMDTLRSAMLGGDSTAVRRFRHLHLGGMLINAVQLGAVAWGMTRLAA